jgi:mannan endo-1,4-beta-mannosidase
MHRREILKAASLAPILYYSGKFELAQADSVNLHPKQLYGICVELNSGNKYIDEIKSFENYVNFKHDIVQYFSSFDVRTHPDMITPYFTTIPLNIWKFGKIPMLTWYPSTSLVEKTPLDICKRIYSGLFDNYLKICCQALVNFINLSKPDPILGTPKIYIRFAHEMNYKNHVFSSNTSDFIKMWKYLYNYVRSFESSSKVQLSKDNVLFIFCPGNFISEAFPFESYYPGDDYVEWKGLDGYNWGGKSWQQFDEIFTPYLIRMNKLSSLPLAICEFGTTAKIINKQNKAEYNVNAKREWIRYAYDWLSKIENLNKYNIRMSVYYNLSRNNDIDSGIFIPNNSSTNLKSLNFATSNYNTIRNLSDVYIKKDTNLTQSYGVNKNQFIKLGFVNNNVLIDRNIFEGKF